MKPSKPLYIINLDVYPNRNLSIDFVEEALFPGLVVAHCLAPRMFPWWIVLVPLVGGLHLAVSWMAAQMIARILLSLVPPSGK
jgi:hypothetical protein